LFEIVVRLLLLELAVVAQKAELGHFFAQLTNQLNHVVAVDIA
jgi:hypothetical protein